MHPLKSREGVKRIVRHHNNEFVYEAGTCAIFNLNMREKKQPENCETLCLQPQLSHY